MCKLKFHWFKIWMTTNDKNRKESTRIESISKSETQSWKNFFKVQTVYFFASWSRFKFICTECIVQELNMLLNISLWNFVWFRKEQNHWWRRLRAYVYIMHACDVGCVHCGVIMNSVWPITVFVWTWLFYSKEIKNAPSALLSYISTREFLRTREKLSLIHIWAADE